MTCHTFLLGGFRKALQLPIQAQPEQPVDPRGSARRQSRRAPRAVQRQRYLEVRHGQGRGAPLRPFDQPQAGFGVIQGQEFELAGGALPPPASG